MIAVMNWVDGFGNDTVIYGIYTDVETAKKSYPINGSEARYVEIEINRPIEADWYDGEPLFPKKYFLFSCEDEEIVVECEKWDNSIIEAVNIYFENENFQLIKELTFRESRNYEIL